MQAAENGMAGSIGSDLLLAGAPQVPEIAYELQDAGRKMFISGLASEAVATLGEMGGIIITLSGSPEIGIPLITFSDMYGKAAWATMGAGTATYYAGVKIEDTAIRQQGGTR